MMSKNTMEFHNCKTNDVVELHNGVPCYKLDLFFKHQGLGLVRFKPIFWMIVAIMSSPLQ